MSRRNSASVRGGRVGFFGFVLIGDVLPGTIFCAGLTGVVLALTGFDDGDGATFDSLFVKEEDEGTAVAGF